MIFYTWHGKEEQFYDKGIDVFIFSIGKYWVQFTLFDYYFGIGVVGKLKIMGKLK